MTEKIEPNARRSRRRFFGLAGAGIAGLLTGKLTSGDDAQASTGDPLTAGQSTSASSKTELSTTGVITNDAAFGVEAPLADYGVKGTAASIGVYGKGPIGVYGEGAVGGVFSGTDTAISLTPTGTSGPSTTQSLKGDVLVDAEGVMWLCVADGTPGTWIKVSHGGLRLLPNPQRVYDSRAPGAGGILRAATPRTIDITATNFGIPANAIAIIGNLTVTETTDFGFLAAYPAGGSLLASNLNWGGPGQTLANAATIKIGTSGQITLYVERSDAHVLVDVSGYVL